MRGRSAVVFRPCLLVRTFTIQHNATSSNPRKFRNEHTTETCLSGARVSSDDPTRRSSCITVNWCRSPWEADYGIDEGGDGRPISKLTHILLTYRQSILVTVYTHLLLLDHSSQVWWRWMNIFFTLVIWSIELLVSGEDDAITKEWKVD